MHDKSIQVPVLQLDAPNEPRHTTTPYHNTIVLLVTLFEKQTSLSSFFGVIVPTSKPPLVKP